MQAESKRNVALTHNLIWIMPTEGVEDNALWKYIHVRYFLFQKFVFKF